MGDTLELFAVCVCSGGGGNFVLSTSLVGYTTVLGAVAPMVHHGYGFFYRIRDDRWADWSVTPAMFRLTAAVIFMACQTARAVISDLHFDPQDRDFPVGVEVLPSEWRRVPVQPLQQLHARDAAPSNNIAALGGSPPNNTSDQCKLLQYFNLHRSCRCHFGL